MDYYENEQYSEVISEVRERFELMAENEIDLIRLKCQRLKEDWEDEFYV